MPGTKLIVERDTEARMRDGVTLRADVYRPETDDKLPVLLQRTPYGKGFGDTSFALMAAERGYVVVKQDTRGRWASDGEYYAFIHEARDGYDTVEWAASQPWANGTVGMFGGSYVGYTQLAAASLRPPALTTIVPTATFCEPESVAFAGGAFALGVAVSWVLVTEVLPAIMGLPDSDERKDRLLADIISAVDGMAPGKTFRFLPMLEMPLVGRDGLSTFVADFVRRSPGDDWWRTVACAYSSLSIPVFHIGGWYDIFVNSTLRDYRGIGEAGNAAQRVLIGPWIHGPMNGLVGDVDFGLRASGALVLPDELQLRWFDHWLKGIETGLMDEPPIRIFVMGDNRWRSEEAWPLARAVDTPYYLHSGGAANTLSGDGELSPRPPSDEPVDAFVYDPRNPVPTRGGGLCCWTAGLEPGAFDQREIERRPDVLVYSSAPLEADVEVTGQVQVHLWAATTAPDTDFTAKLVDVGRCGFARNVQDGIVRARYRLSAGEPEFVQPGDVCEYIIDLGPTSNVFKAGHRIRLEISSSNFPRFDRNPNTGHPPGQDAELRTAVQTVLHDSAHRSHVALPMVPR